MKMRTLLVLAATFLPPAAVMSCETPNDTAVCGGAVVSVSALPSAVVSTDLVVHGAAAADPGAAIRHVTVEGIQAHNDGFNFDTWSATIPIATLIQQVSPAAVDSNHVGTVELHVYAFPACGASASTTLPVSVNVQPGIRVTSLTFQNVTYPGSHKYLPASGLASAVLLVQANPEAAGSTVTLAVSPGSSAPSGTFSGGGSSVRLTLAANGNGSSSASFIFTPTKPAGDAAQTGIVSVTANAGELATSTTIEIVGPPKIFPDSGTISSGASLAAQVMSALDGEVDSCVARAPSGVTVLGTDGVDLTATKGAKSGFKITVPAGFSGAPTSISVTCVDVYGQATTASYVVQP